eukprot:scaffold122709_cov36-Prasinocladus_malaysianus.AAC.4
MLPSENSKDIPRLAAACHPLGLSCEPNGELHAQPRHASKPSSSKLTDNGCDDWDAKCIIH